MISPNPDRGRSRQRSTPCAEAPGAFRRRVPRSAFAARSPPPISKLCRLDPALNARSPTSFRRPARRETATGSSPARLDAKRCSSTSAIDTIHKHDRWIDGYPGLSCSRTSLARSRTGCAPFPSRGRAQPGDFGSGAARGRPRNSASPDEIARVGSFSPARLARTPHVAEPGRPSGVEFS
jgi:hypothetical protein